MLKVCILCKEEKDEHRFTKDKSRKDGFYPICKLCRKIFYEENKEAILKQKKEYHKANSVSIRIKKKIYYEENKEDILAYHDLYREQHKEEIKKYREDNKESLKEYNKQWWKNNTEKHITYENNRRARKLNNGGTFTDQEWTELKKDYEYTCLCCGRREPEIKLTADHVVPLINGGLNNVDNIQPLCRSCNSSKHIKTIDYRK